MPRQSAHAKNSRSNDVAACPSRGASSALATSRAKPAAFPALAHAAKPAVAVAQRRVQLQEVVDITASFRVPGAGVSGIKVETLQVRNEKYKPTQGVRYHTRSGSVIVRA